MNICIMEAASKFYNHKNISIILSVFMIFYINTEVIVASWTEISMTLDNLK